MHNDFFDRTAAEKWELIKEVFWRIFAPRAYATLYSQYQFLRNSIDEMEEEARCDVIDAENEVRRLQRENQALRQQIDALTAQLRLCRHKKIVRRKGNSADDFFAGSSSHAQAICVVSHCCREWGKRREVIWLDACCWYR